MDRIKAYKLRLAFFLVVLIVVFVLYCKRGEVVEKYYSEYMGFVATLLLSLFVWPVVAFGRHGWPQTPPSGLEDVSKGHAPPGSLVHGVLECVVLYLAFLSQAWVVAGAWFVFKAASKWAAWQHIMKFPQELGANDKEKVAFILYRYNLASEQYNAFVIGTLTNTLVAAVGAVIAGVLSNPAIVIPVFLDK